MSLSKPQRFRASCLSEILHELLCCISGCRAVLLMNCEWKQTLKGGFWLFADCLARNTWVCYESPVE